jgi:acyl-CoA hydrolase
LSDPSGPEPRPVSASRVEMTQLVQPPDTNYHGTVFGGRLVQWIDIAAAVSAQRHSRRKVVTASIDDLHFGVPIRLGDIVVLRASVNYAHRTSMEVGVRVEREDPTSGERIVAARAYLTFVGLDESGAKTPVPPVIPSSEAERRRYENAQTRRRLRLERRGELQTGHPGEV